MLSGTKTTFVRVSKYLTIFQIPSEIRRNQHAAVCIMCVRDPVLAHTNHQTRQVLAHANHQTRHMLTMHVMSIVQFYHHLFFHIKKEASKMDE